MDWRRSRKKKLGNSRTIGFWWVARVIRGLVICTIGVNFGCYHLPAGMHFQTGIRNVCGGGLSSAIGTRSQCFSNQFAPTNSRKILHSSPTIMVLSIDDVPRHGPACNITKFMAIGKRNIQFPSMQWTQINKHTTTVGGSNFIIPLAQTIGINQLHFTRDQSERAKWHSQPFTHFLTMAQCDFGGCAMSIATQSYEWLNKNVSDELIHAIMAYVMRHHCNAYWCTTNDDCQFNFPQTQLAAIIGNLSNQILI